MEEHLEEKIQEVDVEKDYIIEEISGFKKPRHSGVEMVVKRSRCLTGIESLDNILNGGIPQGNTVLLTGSVGTGKTTWAMEFLVNGVRLEENGAFISVTEPIAKLLENMYTFDFFDSSMVKEGKLHLFDLSVIYDRLGLEERDYTVEDMDALLGAFEDIVDELAISRLVIDSITAVCFQLQTKPKIRDFIFKLGKFLSVFGCTTILISEVGTGSAQYSVYGVEEAISDGIILLGNIERRGDLLRTLQVIKMRGTAHSRAKYIMDLTTQGTTLTPLLKWGSVIG